MAKKARKQLISTGTVAQNRKARHNYSLTDKLEAGIVLTGTEVKSLRLGQASLVEAYASEENGELFLVNAYIPEYSNAGAFTHNPRRPRKLLLKKKELARLYGAIHRKGMTVVPTSLYFNKRGLAKVELALAEGRKVADKRAAERDRDWGREKARLMRAKG